MGKPLAKEDLFGSEPSGDEEDDEEDEGESPEPECDHYECNHPDVEMPDAVDNMVFEVDIDHVSEVIVPVKRNLERGGA